MDLHVPGSGDELVTIAFIAPRLAALPHEEQDDCE
jgi:hypothetical protein